MDVGEGGFGWLTGWDFYEGNKSKFFDTRCTSTLLYGIPSIDVSEFIWVIILLSGHIILERITSCLLVFLYVCK